MSRNIKKSWKKRLLIALAVVVVLLVIAVATINTLLNSDTFKAKIVDVATQTVKEHTAMQLQINGPFEVSVFPSIGVSLNALTLASIDGQKPAIPFKSLSLEEANFEIGLFSLLTGDPQVKVVDLRNLQAVLISQSDKKQDVIFSFKQIVISDFSRSSGGRASLSGRITWPDNAADVDLALIVRLLSNTNAAVDITSANIKAALAGMAPVAMEASGTLGVESAVPLERIKEISQIKQVTCKDIQIILAGVKAVANGSLNPNTLAGNFTMDANGNPAALLKLAGYEPASAQAAQKLVLDIGLAGDDKVLKIERLSAVFDNMTFEGQGRISGQKQLELNGKLDLGSLAVENYLPKPAAASAQPARPASAEGPARPAGVSPPGLLIGAKADLAITAKEISFAGKSLSNLQAALKGENRKWRIDPLTADVYEGKLNMRATADMTTAQPGLALNGQVSGVGLSHFTPMINGTLNHARADVTARMNDNILSTLNGAMNFNAGGITKAAFSLPAPLNQTGAGITVDNASGSFNIHNGVASTSDLLAKGNLFEGSGGGTINLPTQQLNLALLVKVGGLSIRGINQIPLDVSGPLASPKITINAAKLAEQAARGLIQTPSGVGSNIGDALRAIPGLR